MAINQGFIENYVSQLIIQYSDKPKARAEIELLATHFSKIFSFYNSFKNEFDLDNARGVQLDIIGNILGFKRTQPFTMPKRFFGFSDNPKSGTFGDKFNPLIVEYPFFDKNDSQFTDTQLIDSDYRKFLKAKAAKNAVIAYLISSERIGIQEVIDALFDNNALVFDNKNMSLNLYLDYSVDIELFEFIEKVGLLPKPQGVRYNLIQYSESGTFGFSDNVNAKGFGDKFDSSIKGGLFANKVF